MEAVKIMLRSVLMSCKEGVPAFHFLRDYRTIAEEDLPYRKLGFNSIEDFIKSVPDVVRVGRNKEGETAYFAVANEETAHIQKLIKKQRGSKKKRNIKAPHRRRTPTSQFPPRPPPGGARGGGPPRPPSNRSPFPGIKPKRPGPPRFSQRSTNFQVVVNMQSESTPKRMVRFNGPNRVLAAAMNAANEDREEEKIKFGERFEVPPRFRRKGKENQPQRTTTSSGPPPAPQRDNATGFSAPKPNTRPSNKIICNYDKVENGQKYQERFMKYTEDNDIEWTFEHIPTRMGKDTGYTCLIHMDGQNFGSGDVYGSEMEADFAAAREACLTLNLNIETSPQASVPTSAIDDIQLKSRIKEILSERTNGVWSTRLPVMYKEKYQEEAPPDLEKRVKRWREIVHVEENTATGLAILYPAKEAAGPEVKVVSREPIPAPDFSLVIGLEIPPGEVLNIGEKKVVYLTYIYNCDYFCIQVEDSPCEEIDIKAEELSKNPSPNLSDIKQGSCVVASYNGGWSRAEVISVNGDKLELLYVDYGNEGKATVRDVRWLNEDLAKYPVQAVYCRLSGVMPIEGEVFSDAAKEEFASHVAEKALTAVTKSLDEDGVCEVELFLENDPVSINQKLIDRGLVQAYTAAGIEEEEDSEPEILQLPEDNQWDIYVSFINSSTNSVMVRLIGDQYSELLEEHELKLEEAFHSAGDTPTEFKVDQVCVAYVDELYHRVRVLKKEGKWIEVFFLDHGDTDKVIPDQLRPLDPASNKSLPYQVIEVSLYGLEDPSISENVGALEMVFDLALGKTCVADVVSRDNGISLVLYDTSGEQDVNINELIKKTCSKEAKRDSGTVISKDVSEIIKENSDKLDTKPKSNSSSSDLLSSSTTNPSMTPLHVDTSPRSRESSQKRTPKTTPSTSPGQSSSKSPKSPASSSAKSKQKNYWPSPAKAKPVKNEDEDSWETESEEEEVKDSGKTEVHGGKKDVNSNLKNPSKESKTNSTTEENTDIVNNSGNPSANNVQDITNAAKNVDENDKKLYTWGKPSSGATPGDEWDAQSYNQRQIPPKVKVPDPKNYWDVHVVNVFDPSNFICIPFDGMIPLTDMLKSMMEFFSNTDNSKVLSTEDLKLNHMYAGHQNGAWYRVIIGHVVANDLVSAYLCDFGEYTVMAIDEVKPLPAVYWDQPRLAYKCKLHGVKPSKGSALWSEAAKYKFRSMAHNNSLVAFIDSISDDEIVSLRLVDTAGAEDACLDEVLLTSGFAEKIKS